MRCVRAGETIVGFLSVSVRLFSCLTKVLCLTFVYTSSLPVLIPITTIMLSIFNLCRSVDLPRSLCS